MSLKDSNLFSNPSSQVTSTTFDFEDFHGLLKVLDTVSYESELGKNLKSTLRKFDKAELIRDIENCMMYYYSLDLSKINHKFRVKSLNSILLKYDRYYPSKEVKSCFNDILGFRVLVTSLDFVIKYFALLENPRLRIVDMRIGKSKDDGYRAVHLYYQKSNYHYPIEVQFWDEKDYEFHNWLHKYSYKYTDGSKGVLLRNLFENGLIINESDFIHSLNLIKEK